ncbi:uncharacterized protein LOC103883486 [Papio anubis]|uniref:uncharacterized protein LOC103883486 n=1 Tax=Papio anubis TaxID=9555 RepID=UPI0012AE8CE0|nr:uncharacterized protein LOC103883486 [Papio anubis]
MPFSSCLCNSSREASLLSARRPLLKTLVVPEVVTTTWPHQQHPSQDSQTTHTRRVCPGSLSRVMEQGTGSEAGGSEQGPQCHCGCHTAEWSLTGKIVGAAAGTKQEGGVSPSEFGDMTLAAGTGCWGRRQKDHGCRYPGGRHFFKN